MKDEGPAELGDAGLTGAVLVVDDNEAQRLALRAMLAPLGHAVVEAESGRAAILAAKEHAFSVVLMDVRMPILDGYETARRIRAQPASAHTPIIFVTAFGDDPVEKAAAYANGAVDFIFTPVASEVLRAKVAAFVDLFAHSQELRDSLASIKGLNAALRDSEVRARVVLQNVADGIVTAGEDGLIESFNRAAERMLGYSEHEVLGAPLAMILAPGEAEHYSDPGRERWSLLNASDIPAESTETVGCRKDGSCFPMAVDVSATRIGERTFTIACVRDISGRVAYAKALEDRLLHDELTGLANRAYFGDRVDQALAAAGREGESCAVILLDLDNFRDVNETLGSEVGDELLKAVAARLASVVRDSDVVARLRGDEFGVLPFEKTDIGSVEPMTSTLRKAFDSAFLIGGRAIDVSATIGIAFFPQHGRTSADLLRRADLAMREAKRSGAGLSVFEDEQDDQTARHLTLLSELRRGIPRGELVLHFQPIIELGSTPRTVGTEALVRWLHPTRGLLMPASFMAEAERSDLLDPLTRWVLNEALRQLRQWSEMGFELNMAVNISARSLRQHSVLADTVAALTDSWGIAPGRLTLELTERTLIDAGVPDVLEVLHSMGECLSIDDFGTGHSSLVYLQRLPVDQIKVDRSFVANLATAPGDAVIVRSTIDLAHNLGLTVVAEGVEDEAALDILSDYGCDWAQGYYFRRPCAAEELTEWLTESPFGAQRDAVPR